jgi:hypothetical protein
MSFSEQSEMLINLAFLIHKFLVVIKLGAST